MLSRIQSRLPEVGTTIFTIMSKMAAEEGAINLSQGFPDFPVDKKLIDLIYRYMTEGNNQYAPMAGVPALRNTIAEVIFKTYSRRVDPETEITVTAGGTEAIFSAIAGLVHKGDEVIVFDPAYDSYDPAIRLNGGVPVHINLRYPEFSIDWDEVKSWDSQHIYSDQTVKDRFDWEGKGMSSGSIHVAKVKVYALAQAWVFPYEARYGGCRSWVTLDEAPENWRDGLIEVMPVIS